MRARIKFKGLLLSICCAVVCAMQAPAAFAQCAMCRASVQAAGSTNAAASETLNLAILVLLIPPVLIFCAIFYVAYRYSKASSPHAQEILAENSKLKTVF